MRRSESKRARLGALVLAVALGAAAMLALPGLGIGKGHPRGGEPAGTIQSFDTETGQLVIDLAKGDTISALVTRRTHIRCGDEGRRRHGHGNGHDENSATASHRGEGPPEGNEGPPRGGPDASQGDEGPPPPPQGNRPPKGSSDDDGPGGESRSERCMDRLVVGAAVMGAQIVLIDGDAFYKDIGLVPPAAPSDDE